MPGLIRHGVIPALEYFISDIPPTAGTNINFTYHNIPELSDEKSINIYRIVLEIIHNTLKHANASTLDITMNMANQKLIIETADNGIGFNTSRIQEGKPGLGTLNLVSRVEIMDGEMKLDSILGHGTRYIIKIPIS